MRVTVYTEPSHALSMVLFFDRTISDDERKRARMLLELVQPVLASSAAYRALPGRRIMRPDGRSAPASILAGEDAIRLRDRYGLTVREIE